MSQRQTIHRDQGAKNGAARRATADEAFRADRLPTPDASSRPSTSAQSLEVQEQERAPLSDFEPGF